MRPGFQTTDAIQDGPATAASPPAPVPPSWLDGGLAILDGEGRILETSEPLSAWLQKSPADLAGQSFWQALEFFCADWKADLDQVRQCRTTFFRRDLLYRGTDCQPSQWFNLEIARGPQSCFVRFNSILAPLMEMEESGWDDRWLSDSARREILARLLRAEARLEGMTRRWPCVILSQRADFGVQSASPNIEELTGVAAADWQSQPQRFWQLVHEADAPELQRQFQQAAQAGAATTNSYRIRHARTGRVAYVLEHRQPVRTQNGLLVGYEVLWLDVTRQTIAERRLSTAAWKETLAVLTLGMAHDFTNMIAGIHALSESFLAQIGLGHPFYEGLSLIKKNSLQASQLVRRIINLHLGQVGERNYHDLNALVTDLIDLVKKALPRGIEVCTELSAGTLAVYLDAVELRQALLNLLLNAADAMPEGGVLTLRTSKHQQLPELENLKGVPPRLPCVCLTIEDTGCGISQRHIASVFDPFFTTKSKGSGLGLYNAKIAVEKHQGAISVQSKERIGTTFQIWLPEADFSESPQTVPRPAGASRCFLLSGQAGEMRDKTAELLRCGNFSVVTAAPSESLSDLLQSSDYHFDAALVLVEPNETGLHLLVAQLRQYDKNLKIVLKPAGCAQDDLDGRLLQRIDLVLNPDLPHADMLDKLHALFESKS